MSTLESLFLNVAETSGLVSLLLVPLLLLRPWLRRWVGSPGLCLLWLLILGRLLVPLPVESRWSWSNYWPREGKPSSLVTLPAKVQVSTIPTRKEASVVAPNIEVVTPFESNFSMSRLLAVVWAVGFTMGMAGLGLRIWKTRRLAALTSPVTDAGTLAIYESIPVGIRRNMQLRVTTALDIPTLAGVLRPQIWLPVDWEHKLTPDEMRQVLLHELGHTRRHDLLVQWLFAVAQCLHWFNPLVWIFARYARFDREMACDAWVLTQGGINDPAAYGTTLLKLTRMISNPLRSAPGGTAMAASKRDLTTRIAGIGTFCQRPAWCGIIGVGIVLAGLAVLTTSGVAVEKAPSSDHPPIGTNADPASSSDINSDGVQIQIVPRFAEIPESVVAEITSPDGIFPNASIIKDAKEDKIAILDGAKQDAFLRALGQKRGVDLLSGPRVSVRPGNSASIEWIKEFRYPTKFTFDLKGSPQFSPTAFETKNVGAIANVRATIEADGKTISVHAVPEVIEFLGFKDFDGKEIPKEEANWIGEPSIVPKMPYLPVFSEYRREVTFNLLSGQTAVIWLGTKSSPQKGSSSDHRSLFVFITAKILSKEEVTAMNAEAKAADEARQAAESAKAEASNAPFGFVKPGDKDGFIRSPFAPDAGLIDIRGYDPGTEVVCPYTGKVLRIPLRQ